MDNIKEFPSYPVESLPAIPADWVNASWHKDLCPKWESGRWTIFIDWPEFADRESEVPFRYNAVDIETDDIAYQGDSFEDCRAAVFDRERLAVCFAGVLCGWLSDSQWNEMLETNDQYRGDSCCASHDYCDSNMAMDSAWQLLGLPELNAESEVQCQLWNESWAYAKTNFLTAKYGVYRIQPSDFPSLGIAKGDRTLIHIGDGSKTNCDKMRLNLVAGGRESQYYIELTNKRESN